jgi:hypothetical protein
MNKMPTLLVYHITEHVENDGISGSIRKKAVRRSFRKGNCGGSLTKESMAAPYLLVFRHGFFVESPDIITGTISSILLPPASIAPDSLAPKVHSACI